MRPPPPPNLAKHLDPKLIVIAAHFKFHKASQQESESIRDFQARLKKLAETCEFGGYREEAIRDRFVCGLKERTTFAPEQVHSGSLSWLYICLHDTTTKCYAGASHPGVSSPRFSHRGENFTPVRNLATVSSKRKTTTHFGVKSVCR